MNLLSGNLGLIVSGIIILILGIVLADPVITVLVEGLAGEEIGSFTEASAIGGLVPIVYFMMVLGTSLSLLGTAGYRSLRGS